jgi:hypothetical protein
MRKETIPVDMLREAVPPRMVLQLVQADPKE